MPVIRVSRDVHAMIVAAALPGSSIKHDGLGPNARAHADGSVSFPVDDDVYSAIVAIDPDIDVALRKKFGVKGH